MARQAAPEHAAPAVGATFETDRGSGIFLAHRRIVHDRCARADRARTVESPSFRDGMPRARRAHVNMHIARSILAAVSSIIWPAVVVVIPMGITFSAARVYAESGVAPPPACTDSKVTACADAGAMQTCECAKGFECACTPKQCSATSGGVSEALVCESLTTCSGYSIAPCAGKAAGASCAQTDTAGTATGPGTCGILSNGCFAKNPAGAYETTFPLACAADAKDSGASNAPSGGTDDSGCSMTPGTTGDSTLVGIPLGLGLALALACRRKRRR